MITVFLGIGSNLDDPLSQLKKAVESLKQVKNSKLIKVSSFYSSPPMGPQDQPDYINAVVEMTTRLNAEQLLDELQKIENKQGRVRSQRWGARTLDLDILLYGTELINTKRLTVPHIGISDSVDLNFELPGLGKMSILLAACPMDGIKRLSEAYA